MSIPLTQDYFHGFQFHSIRGLAATIPAITDELRICQAAFQPTEHMWKLLFSTMVVIHEIRYSHVKSSLAVAPSIAVLHHPADVCRRKGHPQTISWREPQILGRPRDGRFCKIHRKATATPQSVCSSRVDVDGVSGVACCASHHGT